MCEREFAVADREVSLKSYGNLGSIENHIERAYDAAIIHIRSGDEKWYGTFEKIRARWPGMRIIFATDTYDYVYDFRYWMADACMVVLDSADEYRTLNLLAAGMKMSVDNSSMAAPYRKPLDRHFRPAGRFPL